MNPIPLDQIRLRWRDHKSALWWLGLLYRRPVRFEEAVGSFPLRRQLLIVANLYFHFLPNVILICALGWLALLRGLPKDLHWPIPVGGGIAFGIVGGITFRFALVFNPENASKIVRAAFMIAIGIPIGILIVIVGGIASDIASGIASGIACGMACGIGMGGSQVIGPGIGSEIASRIAWGIFLGISLGIACRIEKGIAVGIAGGIACGIACGIAGLRLYYHPLAWLFVWPRLRGRWYPYHPAAWDDHCAVPFPSLDRLLVAYAAEKPEAAESEIERLITSSPTQRTAALRARTMLVARQACAVDDLTRLDEIVAKLPEGEKGFLRQTPQLRQRVQEISELQIRLNTIDRPIFREPTARLLKTEIENFRSQISGFERPLATEFGAAAQQWQQIAEHQFQEAKAILSKEPTLQVFRAGDPVDRDREAFVLRYKVVGELERQVMLSTGCPGIVLYGRRRMGKSTVLRNLDGGFLPPSVLAVAVSMQDPRAFTSLKDFLRHIAQQVQVPTGIAGAPADLAALYNFVGECNARLGKEDKRLLLALDEYEMIDAKIGEGVFPVNLLDAIRESIQTHRQIT